MQIQRLKIKNFKSFYDDTELNFNELQGLWRISGQIGSGKTTLGEAIIYGLYGTVQGKNNSDLISWGEKHGLVEIWCRSRGNNLYIRREINAYRQSPLSVEVNGEPMDISNKRSAQQQLEQEYLDVSRGTMELLCIISFNNFKSLSTLNSKDTKLFLDQVLGMDILTEYINKSKQKLADLNTEYISTSSALDILSRQFQRMSSKTPQIDSNASEVRQEIISLSNEIKSKTEEFDNIIRPLADSYTELLKSQSSVLALGKQKAKEIKLIQGGICPTCHQNISQDLLPEATAERQKLLDSYQEITENLHKIDTKLKDLKSRRDKELSELKARLKEHELKLTRINEASRFKKATDDELAALQDNMTQTTDKLNLIHTDMDAYDILNSLLSQEIRQKILEYYIKPINQKIREYTASLSLPYIPEFDSQFKCTVKTGTLQSIPTSSLSTGQLKMVDMVIILGVLGSVLTKANCNVMILDELFSNLDPRTRSELITVLNNALPDNTSCFIVSHQDLDEETFSGTVRLKLESNGERMQSHMIINRREK